MDVRIITATNKDLIQETMEGRFREDLYYRLNVLDLEIPPLRERGDDVRVLGLHLFHRLPGGNDPDMQARFLQKLSQVGDYPWYGNIRELQNFVERVNILMRNNTDFQGMTTEMMRRRSASMADPAKRPAAAEAGERERGVIEAALRNYPDSMEEAAQSLGCSRQTLWRKMKKYGITRP